MGVKKKPTLKILFRQFAISLIVMLVAAIIVPFGLEGLAVNAGLATRANLSELQVKEIIPTLTIAPDITKVVIPQGCGYLILDKNFNELYSNMDDDEKEIALLYAKGEYIEYATGRQFALVVRENEFCVLRYYIGSQFTVSWLPEYFPSPIAKRRALSLKCLRVLKLMVCPKYSRFFKMFTMVDDPHP